eukprot:gene7927-9314_t
MRITITIIAILAFVAYVHAQKCTVTIEGNSFDLSPLIKQYGDEDYQFTSGKDIFFLNICNNTVGEKNPCGNESPAVKYNTDSGKCTNLGSGGEFWSLHQDGDVTGIVVQYMSGDIAKKNNARNHISYVFHCNPEAGAGSPQIVEISEYQHIVAHWTSAYACPQVSVRHQ